jgi:hypothetical protein
MRTRYPVFKNASFSGCDRYLFITWGPESIVISSVDINISKVCFNYESAPHHCVLLVLVLRYATDCSDQIRFGGIWYFSVVEDHSIWHALLQERL